MELSSDNFSKDFLFFLALNIRKNIKDRNFEQKNINEYCYDIANGKNEMIRFTLEAMGYIANFDPENLIISITNKNDPMNTETMSVDKSKPDIFLRLGKEKKLSPIADYKFTENNKYVQRGIELTTGFTTKENDKESKKDKQGGKGY